MQNYFQEYNNFNQNQILQNQNQSNYNYIIRQEIYNNIVNYFGDIIFTKLNSKATSDGTVYGLYYCKVGCMLCIDNRYLLVIVKEDTNGSSDNEIPVGTQMYLSNVKRILTNVKKEYLFNNNKNQIKAFYLIENVFVF